MTQFPPIIPREILFGNPQKSSSRLSRDEHYLAYLAPDEKNILQVWLRTLGEENGQDRKLTDDKKRGIHSYFWTYKPEQLIYLQDSDGDENFHLYLVNIKANIILDLTPFQGVKAQIIDLDPDFPDEILVGLNLKDLQKFDAYRINLNNGAVELDTENPGNIVDWTANAKFQILAATEFLKFRSPLFFVDEIEKPLLIGQGANDPRVKEAESEQIVEIFVLMPHFQLITDN